MNKFVISTDSGCDYNLETLKEKDVCVIRFQYGNKNETKIDSLLNEDKKEFYDSMRNGVVWKTSQINPDEYYNYFEEIITNNPSQDIVHVSLSSGLSSTINSAFIARDMLKEKYKNEIYIIDSKIASLGEAMLVDELIKLRSKDVTPLEAYEIVNDMVKNIRVFFTTNTLEYFARGGRLSRVSAFLGNVFRINPILDTTKDGKLRVIKKCRGEHKTLQEIIKGITENVVNPSEQTLYVCHADNDLKAEEYAKIIKSEIGFKDVIITYMGPIIGSHAGPGLLAFFYKGEEKKD